MSDFYSLEEMIMKQEWPCPKCGEKCELDKRIDGRKFDTFIVCKCGYEECKVAGAIPESELL